MKERKPIFYDAERARWRLTRRVMEITGALLTLLLAYFFVTIVVSVELPAGLLPDIKPAFHALKSSKKKPIAVREGRRRRVANIGKVPESYDPLRAAFYVSWDANSLAPELSFNASLKPRTRSILVSDPLTPSMMTMLPFPPSVLSRWRAVSRPRL